MPRPAILACLCTLPALGPVLSTPAHADAAGDPRGQLAAAWCAALVARDEGAAVALMSPDLQQAVGRARLASAAFEAAHPGEKPPLGDGLRLTAFPDSIESCQVDSRPDGSLRLTLQPAGSADGAWFDDLEAMAGPDGALVVGDVRFSGSVEDRLSLWLEEGALAD